LAGSYIKASTEALLQKILMESLLGLAPALTREEKEAIAKEKLAKYKDDEDYICYEDEEEAEVYVAKKFSDDDWKNVEKMIDEHPLFCKEFKDVESNDLLLALQTLKYDESAEKILENLYVGEVFTTERR